MLAPMSKKVKGSQADFLRQVTDQTAKRQRYGTWRSAAAAIVLKEAVTQTLGMYIDKRQATVAGWMALKPIIEV